MAIQYNIQNRQQNNKIDTNINIPSMVRKSIQKIHEGRNHSKKMAIQKCSASSGKSSIIKRISKDALYLSNLITDLNPAELIHILINQFKNQLVIQLSDYKFQINKCIETIDFLLDEDEKIVEQKNQIYISFNFEVFQLEESPSHYTLIFQNLSKQHSLEFMKLEQQILNFITSF